MPLSVKSLWTLLCRNSHQPTDALSDSSIHLNQNLSTHFALRYAVYHYYRSQGWVVKCGLKFGTDFVLYKRGPSFKHSDYAVIIMPSIDGDTCELSKSWTCILGMTRVCGQVKKVRNMCRRGLQLLTCIKIQKLLIAYVKIPAEMQPQDLQQPETFLRFQIWDVLVSRWVPSKAL